MKKILITRSDDGIIKVEPTEGFVFAQEALELLLNAYVIQAKWFIENHGECNDPECHSIETTQRMIEAITYEVEAHQHKHD